MICCFTKMTTAQLTASSQPRFSLNNITPFHHSKPFLLPITITPSSSPILFTTLPQKPSLNSRKPLPLCFAGGKGGMMQNNEENSPWKSLSNAMEKFKGKSIEDVLRQQIQKGEYLDNGGSGSKPPGGGGGDGGSGRPDDTGGSEDESFLGIQDETLQVILATGALLSFYVYLLWGKFLIKLIWDLIKCVSGGGVSNRLSKILRRLGALSGMGKKKEVVDEYWLEKQIMRTPTWWYDPRDYRRAVRNYYASSSASEPDGDGDVDEDA